jgi:hypothetical protein
MRLPQEDVEILLTRQARAHLPLVRQFLLYLDPFAFFKDASRGPAYLQEMALAYNRGLRWLLASYLRRWVVIAASLFIAIEPAEALAGQISHVPAAAFAVGCCIAVTVTVCTAVAYILLGLPRVR